MSGDSASVTIGLDDVVARSAAVEAGAELVADEVRAIPGVLNVSIARRNGGPEVVVDIEGRNPPLQSRIYSLYRRALLRFADTPFELSVVYRRNDS